VSDQGGYYGHLREERVPFLSGGCDRVLEVGCGEGAFRTHFSPTCEYWGIEPDEGAATVAASKLHTVLVGTYEEVAGRAPERYFDLVVSNDVIEHMVDPAGFLRAVGRHLRDGGRLVASVPNVRYVGNLKELLVAKDWRYREEGILDASHLRFFTERSLRRVLAETGWEILALEGINPVSLRGGSWWNRVLGTVAHRAAFLLLGRDLEFLQFAVCARRRAPGG